MAVLFLFTRDRPGQPASLAWPDYCGGVPGGEDPRVTLCFYAEISPASLPLSPHNTQQGVPGRRWAGLGQPRVKLDVSVLRERGGVGVYVMSGVVWCGVVWCGVAPHWWCRGRL